jgi:hypothetical protein
MNLPSWLSNWQDYIFIVLLVAVLIWSMTRRRKAGNAPADAAMAIFANVNDNLKILEDRLTNWQSKKKFQSGAWKMYKDKLNFLDPSLMSSISESFTLAEDFNSRIDSARKNRVMATLQDMPLEKLRGPLTKSKEGLTNWFKTSYQTEAQSSQRRGCGGF